MKISLNLASRTYVNRRALFAGYVAAGIALGLLLALNLTFFWHSRSEIRDLDRKLAAIKEQLGTLTAEGGAEFSPAAYKDLLQEIEFANAILEKDGFRWSALLNQLEGLVPEGVSVRGLRPDHKARALRITAVARGVDEMRAFLDRLMASENFSDLFLLSQEKTEVTDYSGRKREAVKFDLEIQEAF